MTCLTQASNKQRVELVATLRRAQDSALQRDGTFNNHRQQNQWIQSTFESDRINSVFRLYQSMVLALTQGGSP